MSKRPPRTLREIQETMRAVEPPGPLAWAAISPRAQRSAEALRQIIAVLTELSSDTERREVIYVLRELYPRRIETLPELLKERDELLAWEDTPDEWTDRVKAAFPTNSGSHAEYATAMKMIGHRHSKGELVALVNWLLVELKKAKEARR